MYPFIIIRNKSLILLLTTVRFQNGRLRCKQMCHNGSNVGRRASRKLQYLVSLLSKSYNIHIEAKAKGYLLTISQNLKKHKTSQIFSRKTKKDAERQKDRNRDGLLGEQQERSAMGD